MEPFWFIIWNIEIKKVGGLTEEIAVILPTVLHSVHKAENAF